MKLLATMLTITALIAGYYLRKIQYPEYCPKCHTTQTTNEN